METGALGSDARTTISVAKDAPKLQSTCDLHGPGMGIAHPTEDPSKLFTRLAVCKTKLLLFLIPTSALMWVHLTV